MKITQVKEFNQWARNKKSWILIFTKGNGSMVDEPRKNGYVVSGYVGNDSHKYFSNITKVKEFIAKTIKK